MNKYRGLSFFDIYLWYEIVFAAAANLQAVKTYHHRIQYIQLS